jgi:hypothetical protein
MKTPFASRSCLALISVVSVTLAATAEDPPATTNAPRATAPADDPAQKTELISLAPDTIKPGEQVVAEFVAPSGTNVVPSRVAPRRVLTVEEAGGVLGYLRLNPRLIQVVNLVNPLANTNLGVGGFRSSARPMQLPRAFRDDRTHEAGGWNLLNSSW